MYEPPSNPDLNNTSLKRMRLNNRYIIRRYIMYMTYIVLYGVFI